MGHRSAEYGHHIIADMLVDRSAIAGDKAVGDFKESAENAVDFLRIHIGAHFREADDIGEQHSDRASFAGGSPGRCGGFVRGGPAAAAAEFLTRLVREVAFRAARGKRHTALAAKAPAFPILSLAFRTLQDRHASHPAINRGDVNLPRLPETRHCRCLAGLYDGRAD
jgi:hypothetical protein